jgi:hypothetical protein
MSANWPKSWAHISAAKPPRSKSGKSISPPRMDVVSANRRWMDAGLLDQVFFFADW